MSPTNCSLSSAQCRSGLATVRALSERIGCTRHLHQFSQKLFQVASVMIWLLWLPATLAAPGLFPLVDPGLFVISGVKTCGGGGGYCLLGLDCTLDEDFLPDDSAGQHCEGLRSAFTPSAHFVCCRAANRSAYKPPIVLPAVTDPDLVTSRTTTLDVLQNEIGQVLLKVAESVDAVKNTPATEATHAPADVIEFRESMESQSSEEEMAADSPDDPAADAYEYPEEISTESVKSEGSISLNGPPKENNDTSTNVSGNYNTIISNRFSIDETTNLPNNTVTEFINEDAKPQNDDKHHSINNSDRHNDESKDPKPLYDNQHLLINNLEPIKNESKDRKPQDDNQQQSINNLQPIKNEDQVPKPQDDDQHYPINNVETIKNESISKPQNENQYLPINNLEAVKNEYKNPKPQDYNQNHSLTNLEATKNESNDSKPQGNQDLLINNLELNKNQTLEISNEVKLADKNIINETAMPLAEKKHETEVILENTLPDNKPKLTEDIFPQSEDNSNDVSSTNDQVKDGSAVNNGSTVESSAITTNVNNSISQETPSEDDSISREHLLENTILPGEPTKTLNKESELLDDPVTVKEPETVDLTLAVTATPVLSGDQVTKKPEETNDNAEWIKENLNKTKHSPLDKISNNQTVVDSGTPNTNLTEAIKHNSNVTKDELSSVNNSNMLNNINSQTKHTTGDRLVTSTTVSPGTQTPHNEGPQGPPGTEGQLGVAAPCSAPKDGNCTTEVKFVLRNRTLCFGSLYSVDWILTSASCALRIFRIGMVNVSISPLSGSQAVGVKTIVIHESYGETAGSSGQDVEPNNIGLVQMKESQSQWAPCVACLPRTEGRDAPVNCSAITSLPVPPPMKCSDSDCATSRSTESSLSVCEGPVRALRDGHGLPYLTLACDTPWEPRNKETRGFGSGAPLMCHGEVTGVEGSAGAGLLVYTPLAPLLPWVRRNILPLSGPEQRFNIG